MLVISICRFLFSLFLAYLNPHFRLSRVLIWFWLLWIYAQSVECVLVIGVQQQHDFAIDGFWCLLSLIWMKCFVGEPNVPWDALVCVLNAYVSKTACMWILIDVVLLHLPRSKWTECKKKYVHVCFTSNHIFSASWKTDQMLYSRFQVNGDWRAVCAQASSPDIWSKG